MITIREHIIGHWDQWQAVAMYDGAKPLQPFFRGDQLILPCIENDERDEVGEIVWCVQANDILDEAFARTNVDFVGNAVCRRGQAFYLFVEVEDDTGPVRRISHPALQDAAQENPQEGETGTSTTG